MNFIFLILLSCLVHPKNVSRSHNMQVTTIEGSQLLIECSSTPAASKKLIEVPGYLHAMMSNKPVEVLELSNEWIGEQLKAIGK